MTDMIGGAVPRPLHTGAGATGPGAGAIPPDIVTATSSRPDCGGDLAFTHKHTSPKQGAVWTLTIMHRVLRLLSNGQ
jgi:hypothetical protein